MSIPIFLDDGVQLENQASESPAPQKAKNRSQNLCVKAKWLINAFSENPKNFVKKPINVKPK